MRVCGVPGLTWLVVTMTGVDMVDADVVPVWVCLIAGRLAVWFF